jgi:hypothetical protein
VLGRRFHDAQPVAVAAEGIAPERGGPLQVRAVNDQHHLAGEVLLAGMSHRHIIAGLSCAENFAINNAAGTIPAGISSRSVDDAIGVMHADTRR